MLKKLSWKLYLSILVFVVLIFSVYFSTLIVNGRQKNDLLAAELVESQITLVAKMENSANLATPSGSSIKQEMASFDRNMELLLNGGTFPDSGVNPTEKLHPASGTLKAELDEISGTWNEFKSNLQKFSATGSTESLTYINQNADLLEDDLGRVVTLLQSGNYSGIYTAKGVELTALVLSLAAAVGFIFFYSFTVVFPIRELLKASEDFTSGNGSFSGKLPVRTKDEIGKITDQLNKFTQKLGRSLIGVFDGFKESTVQLSTVDRKLKSFSRSFDMMDSGLDSGMGNIENITASIEEQSSGIEEISASSQALSKAAEEFNSLSADMMERANEGHAAITDVVDTMEKLKKKIFGVSSKARELAVKAKTINTVVETVTSISEQTNLLALNAAIEAARAGEAGKGFTVVSDEIRKLAEESKRAAMKISANLKEVMDGTEGSADEMSEMSETVNKVVSKNGEAIDKISLVLENLKSVSEMASNVAASAQEQGASTEEMSAAAQDTSLRVTKLSEMMHSITWDEKEMNKSVRVLTDELGDLTGKIEKIIGELSEFRVYTSQDYKNELGKAITAHGNWMAKLEKTLSDGDRDLETNHKRCGFGVFFQSTSAPDGCEELWEKIGAYHEQLHSSAHGIYQAIDSGDRKTARERFEKARALSKDLLGLLKECREKC